MDKNTDRLYASAEIHGSSAYQKLYGIIMFKQMGKGTLVTAEIFHLPEQQPSKPDIFAFHIHEGTDCSGNEEDFFSEAGSHYNPNDQPHPFHAGDLPPLFGNHGYAYMSVFTDRFTVQEIIGRVIVIHRNPDDFTTQPAGNAGEKMACGKIEVGAPPPYDWHNVFWY